jgi:hypothetical protein
MTDDELRAALSNVLGKPENNSGPGAGAQRTAVKDTGSTGLADVATNAPKAAKGLWDVFDASKNLVIGFAGAKQQIGMEAAGIADKLAEMGAPGAVKLMGQGATTQLGAVREQAGSGLGGEFMKMQNDLRAAGLTVQDYTTLMNNSKTALNDFGGTAIERAQGLSAAGDKLQQSANATGLNAQIGQQELGKIMLLSQMGRTEQLNTAGAQKKAADSALNLANTINETAARTGKSRDAIEAELAERLSSAEVQAKLKNATDDQRIAIINSQAQIAGMGKTAGDTATTIQNNGRLNQEQQIQLMSMGPKAMGEFIKANQLIAKGRVEEGNALLQKSQIDKATYQATPQFQRLMQNAPDQLKSGLQKSYTEDQEAGGVRAAQRQGQGTGQTPAQIEAARRAEAANTAKGLAPSGQVNPNVAPSIGAAAVNAASYNQANDALKVFNSNLSQVASSKAGQDALSATLKALYGKGGTLEQSVNNMTALIKQNVSPATDRTGTATGPQAGPVPPPPKPNTTTTTTPTSNSAGGPVPPPPKPRAAGGPIAPDDLYMVGENGPELFKSKVAGDILPTDKFKSMFGDIKTKISSIGGASKTDASNMATPKFEMPMPAPKMDIPKFEMPMPAPKMDIPKFDPTTVSRAEQDTAKKAERDAAEATSLSKQQPPPAKSPEPIPIAGGTVSMKDLNDSLIRLNSSMDKMLKATLDISSHSEKTAKNSGKATGNRTHA